MRIDRYKVVFWDFDGVIKDSVNIKTDAFVSLFEDYEDDVALKVREHHLANGGMSRFDKLPIYLQWAGEDPSEDGVRRFSDRFSRKVMRGVINAPWVPGAENFLRLNSHDQQFVLTSATPRNELDIILKELNLERCFISVFGAPVVKKDAISVSLKELGVNPRECLMIGDARADLEAAQANQVPFLLRRHETNVAVFADYAGLTVRDLSEL